MNVGSALGFCTYYTGILHFRQQSFACVLAPIEEPDIQLDFKE